MSQLTIISLKNKKNCISKSISKKHREEKIRKLSMQLNYYLFSIGQKIDSITIGKLNDINLSEFKIVFEKNKTFIDPMKARKCIDNNNVSRQCYTNFRNELGLEKFIPSYYSIKGINNKINESIPFKWEPNFFGFFVKDITAKITFVLSKLVKMGFNVLDNGSVINLKIVADGKCVNHSNTELLNIAFCIIYKNSNSKAEAGNYILG